METCTPYGDQSSESVALIVAHRLSPHPNGTTRHSLNGPALLICGRWYDAFKLHATIWATRSDLESRGGKLAESDCQASSWALNACYSHLLGASGMDWARPLELSAKDAQALRVRAE